MAGPPTASATPTPPTTVASIRFPVAPFAGLEAANLDNHQPVESSS
jgi:hypothetical protein